MRNYVYKLTRRQEGSCFNGEETTNHPANTCHNINIQHFIN